MNAWSRLNVLRELLTHEFRVVAIDGSRLWALSGAIVRIYGNPMARLQQISAWPWHSTIVRVVGLSSACRKSSANGFSLVSNALLPLLYLLILTGLAVASVEG